MKNDNNDSMKKFLIIFSVEYNGEFEIEADSELEAEIKAKDYLDTGQYTDYLDNEYVEIEDICELKK